MKRLFISSTYTDLISERKAAIEIVDREHHAVAMEKFFAEDHQAKEVCLQKLQNCDGAILIIGDRYGSIDPTDGVSITEIEYTTAKSLGIPVFVLIKTGEDGSWQSAESERDRIEKHEKFKKRIDEEKHRRTFQNATQLQTEILGAIANYEREHGELGIRLRAFVKPDQFFKPFTDPSRLFNHRWTLVGRSESLDKLHRFVRSNKKVATIYGRGTVGKTKLLFEFSRRFRSRHRNQRLLFLRDGVPLDQEVIKQIPSQQTVIVVDDAHRRGDLKFLLQTAQQYPERIKLLFSARPQGKDFIKTSIAEVGFDTKAIEDLAELKDLTRAELKQLAAQVLGQRNKNLVDSLVAATGDSPLVTLVGAQLLKTQSIDPRLLERVADFQYTVLSRFQDAVTGTISDRINPTLSQNLLALISALAPIRPHEQQFQDAAAAFLGVSKARFVDAIGVLEEQGILTRRGYSLRINPDVLSDHILHKACLTARAQPTGFAEEIFSRFSKIAADRVLRNFAELDWRITKTGGSSRLLDRIWTDIERTFRKGSNYERTIILEWLGKIAYYQPARALPIVEFAIRHPSNSSGNKNLGNIYKFTHTDISRAVPKVIQAIGYNIEYLPRCCDLLWELGRTDSSRPNSNLDSPMRILLDFAKYDIGKPVYVNRIVLDAVERWIKEPDCHSHTNSPLDILDALLAKEGMSSRSEGIKVLLQSFPVSGKNTKDLRERAIKLLEQCAQSESIGVVIRALHSLTETLRPPHGSLGRSTSGVEKSAWVKEDKRVLDIVSGIAHVRREPIVHVRIVRDLRWYTHHASSEIIRRKAKRVIQSIAENFEHLLTKALWYNSWDWEEEDEDNETRDYEKRAQETQRRARQIAHEFMRRYPKPRRGYAALTDCLENFTLAGIPANAGYFLSTLSLSNSTYAAGISRLVVQKPNSKLGPYLASLLTGVRRDQPLAAKTIIKVAIETRNDNLCSAAAQFFSWNEDLKLDDLLAIKRLLKRKSPVVKKMAIHALSNFKGELYRDVIGVITSLRVVTKDFAEDVFRIFDDKAERFGIPFSALRDSDISKLLNILLNIPEVTDHEYHIDKFLGYATKRTPLLVAKLFFKRLDRKRKQGRKQSYHPLPFLGFRFAFKGISANPDYLKIINELLRRAARADGLDHFWLPTFFEAVSDGFCQASLDGIKPWIRTGDRIKVEAAALLLKSAPSNFLFEQIDFVVEILENAHAVSEDCYKNVGSDLFSCAVTGLREGTPGEPKSHDVNILDRAREALKRLQPGSPGYRFYQSLVQYAEKEIRDDLARFEEDFEV
jgi:hypothetical protein